MISSPIPPIIHGLKLQAELRSVLGSQPLLGLAITTGIIAILTLLARWLLLRFIPPLLNQRSPLWADIIKKRRVLTYTYLIVPGLLTSWLVEYVPGLNPNLSEIVNKMADVYVIIMLTTSVSSALLAYNDFYNEHYDFAKDVPIKTVIQSTIILISLFSFLAILGIMLDVPILVLVGIVAIIAAIAAYMFREPILGFSASLQLFANHMLSIGDWILMPSFEVDGEVEDINITSTKVRNWDNSIVNVPTYAFVQNDFSNWNSMQSLEARRIKRPIYIDQHSISFAPVSLRATMLERITRLYDDLSPDFQANKGQMGVKPDDLRARVQVTNLELFMAYATQIIASHPDTRSDYDIYMRPLDPSPQGLPVETYFFTREFEFVPYYAVQREIFGHLLASLAEFDLRAFQFRAEDGQLL